VVFVDEEADVDTVTAFSGGVDGEVDRRHAITAFFCGGAMMSKSMSISWAVGSMRRFWLVLMLSSLGWVSLPWLSASSRGVVLSPPSESSLRG
jgi:hypothetical protein